MFKLVARWFRGAFTVEFTGTAGEQLTELATLRRLPKLAVIQRAMSLYHWLLLRKSKDGMQVALVDRDGKVVDVPDEYL